MDAADMSTALVALATQIATYIPAVLVFLGAVLGIKIGFAWFSKIGRKGS